MGVKDMNIAYLIAYVNWLFAIIQFHDCDWLIMMIILSLTSHAPFMYGMYSNPLFVSYVYYVDNQVETEGVRRYLF